MEEMDQICGLGFSVHLVLFVIGVNGRDLAARARYSREILRVVVLEDEDLEDSSDTAEYKIEKAFHNLVVT